MEGRKPRAIDCARKEMRNFFRSGPSDFGSSSHAAGAASGCLRWTCSPDLSQPRDGPRGDVDSDSDPEWRILTLSSRPIDGQMAREKEIISSEEDGEGKGGGWKAHSSIIIYSSWYQNGTSEIHRFPLLGRYRVWYLLREIREYAESRNIQNNVSKC